MNKLAFRFSDFIKKVPKVNLASFLNNQPSINECKMISDAFHHYGCVIVQDPRVNQDKNQAFINCLERYFSKRQEQLDRGQRLDIYQQLSYEVGLVPPYVQQIIDETEKLKKLNESNKSLAPLNKPLSRMRFLWNIGEVTPDIPANKIPKDFPQMEHVLDDWGNTNLNTIFTVSQMLAVGLGLPRQTITEMLKGGATKLSPNAHDLRRCSKEEAFIGFHYDFGFMTIHGRSRYPGLSVWLANGEKVAVSIPKGHLFLQAGDQIEYLTGGYIHCGYHQAIYTPQVQRLKKKALEEGREPWRVTSTMFAHLRGDVLLEPLKPFANEESIKKYKPITQSELMKISIDLRNKK